MVYEKEIAELKAKLAESEEKYKKAYQEGLLQKQFDKDMEIDQLKQQLAEKNADLHQIYSHLGVEAFCEDIHEQSLKEIGRLQQQLAEKEKEIEEFRFKERNLFPLVENLEEKVNQDKNFFCVKQLESLKSKYLEIIDNKYFSFSVRDVLRYVVLDIDRQIEKLKGVK